MSKWLISTIFIITFSCLSATEAVAVRSGNEPDSVRLIKQQEEMLNARIGAVALNPDGRLIIAYRGNEHFPLNSTHKVFLCAALLRNAEKGKLNLADKIFVRKTDIVPYSPITEKYIYPAALNWRQLCSAAISYSDNTAANLISAELGGPSAATQFFRDLGDKTTQLNRYEPDLNSAVPGDKRDTTTPLAVARDLRIALFGDILQEKSRQELTQWMRDDAVADDLLRKTLPQGWIIADKSGAGGYGSRSIIAAVWPKGGGRAWIIAIYMTETKASIAQRNKAIAQIGAAIFAEIQKSMN